MYIVSLNLPRHTDLHKQTLLRTMHGFGAMTKYFISSVLFNQAHPKMMNNFLVHEDSGISMLGVWYMHAVPIHP